MPAREALSHPGAPLLADLRRLQELLAPGTVSVVDLCHLAHRQVMRGPVDYLDPIAGCQLPGEMTLRYAPGRPAAAK